MKKTDKQIDQYAAQDAYWYADCCANDGEGEVFGAGAGRVDISADGTLRGAWRATVAKARQAGIDLSGLEMRRGTIATRAAALMARIRVECAKVGIIASCGETVVDQAREDQSTPRKVAEAYGIAHLVPADMIAEPAETVTSGEWSACSVGVACPECGRVVTTDDRDRLAMHADRSGEKGCAASRHVIFPCGWDASDTMDHSKCRSLRAVYVDAFDVDPWTLARASKRNESADTCIPRGPNTFDGDMLGHGY